MDRFEQEAREFNLIIATMITIAVAAVAVLVLGAMLL